jgi:hypothetical protein
MTEPRIGYNATWGGFALVITLFFLSGVLLGLSIG